MIDRTELERARAVIFADPDERLILDNHEARYAIEVLELVDRMVDANLVTREGDPDTKPYMAAETAFDAALNELLTTVNGARERLANAASQPEQTEAPRT